MAERRIYSYKLQWGLSTVWSSSSRKHEGTFTTVVTRLNCRPTL